VPVRVLAVVLLLSVAGWPPVGPAPDLRAAYPNPATPGDAGEFVVLDVPEGATVSAYELADGEEVIRLPAVETSGRVAIAANGTVARLAGYPVVEVARFPALSNAGETITIRRASDGTVVDTLHVEATTTAELQTDRGSHPLGATAFEPTTVENATVTPFVLPDDPSPVLAALRRADDRILLGGYSFTSTSITNTLLAAVERDVAVRLVLDGAPVGGDTPAQVAALDRLAAAGVDVQLVGGPRARYAFHHAKYAVADDAAIVLTENWKASGTGGHGNRGWGIVVHDPRFADALAAVFTSDADWVGSSPWQAVSEPASGSAAPAANESYPRQFSATQVRSTRTTLAVTPDNAEPVVLGFVRGANESLHVQQVSLREGRLRRAVVDAAERGVTVELLLSSRWYVRTENQLLARCLNGYADRAGLPLTVRLVDPRSRFGKVHAKVAVADGERVLLGSLNWNDYALERNREVVVVAAGEDLAAYYQRVFVADWRGGAWRLPWSVLLVALLAIGGACWLLSKEVVVAEHVDEPRNEGIWTTDPAAVTRVAAPDAGALETGGDSENETA
jgi:phosphatidylserine/phosphatidylglycerophosphate/cardiolipin synthase-like enzyme